MATVDVYRTNDGKAYFEYSFVNVGNYYEVDIVSQPSYNSRDSSLHSTHRLTSKRGGHKVCFGNESDANSLNKTKKLVEAWAEGTWRYIQTGRSF